MQRKIKIKIITLNARFTHSGLALFYVRNEISKRLDAADTELCQFTINDPYYETLLKVTERNPEIIMFSVSTWNVDYTLRLVRDIITALPGTRIILGGPEATFMAAGAFPEGCTIVRGEVEGLEDGFFQDLAKGCLGTEYIAQPGKPYSYPYEEKDFVTHLRNRSVYYESSRGCPFSCSYCLSAIGRKVYNKGISEVKAELDRILAHNPKSLRFVDRTFNASSERALEIWKHLAARKTQTVFHFEIAPDRFTEEMFVFLETIEPGRFDFEIGIQSTNPETLKAVHRSMDLDAAAKNISRLVGLDNIHLHVDLILGLPYETVETFRQSFNDVFRMKPHYIQMGLLKILPGTPISTADDYGLAACRNPPYQILKTRWMSHETLADLYWFGECVEAFYNKKFFRNVCNYLGATEQNPFAVFKALAEFARARGFFDLAKTQEFMNAILVGFTAERQDRAVIVELLRFDWLKSGHRFLPEILEDEPIKKIKDDLRKMLPQSLAPFYDYANRDEFFKKGMFSRFSGPALRALGLSEYNAAGWVVFFPEQDPGISKGCSTALLVEDQTPIS
ncbi:MAG: B12-binding domain-containing radical SAM protein [Proteobacteria bacterium]|nr:B12-binding domain-containing radical SAM protein [Pseudomonadota bacterium]MBU1710778.1 B12-binding domain-containing radical SAM protein [Pseudomonadota bacterium]